jgi:hypothetical protein
LSVPPSQAADADTKRLVTLGRKIDAILRETLGWIRCLDPEKHTHHTTGLEYQDYEGCGADILWGAALCFDCGSKTKGKKGRKDDRNAPDKERSGRWIAADAR